MANTIDFNINSNGAEVLNKTAAAAENTATGFKSAKAELRALQNQLQQMDKTSEEFKKASARAAELKDNISDLSAEISANAGNAFEGLSNNVGLFGSRLMDLDLKGAGQALSAMGGAVGRIDFKTIKDEVGGLAKGLKDLGLAVISNPFFLIAGALAAIAYNYKDIAKWATQTTQAQQNQAKVTEDLNKATAEELSKNAEKITQIEVLTNRVKDNNLTEKDRRKALKDLEEMYPAYFSNINGDINDTEALNKAKEKLVANILAEAKANAAKRLLEEAYSKRIALEMEINAKKANLTEQQINDALEAARYNSQTLFKEANQATSEWLNGTNGIGQAMFELENANAQILLLEKEATASVQKGVDDYVDGLRKKTKAAATAAQTEAEKRQKEIDDYNKSQQELTEILEKWEQERLDAQLKAQQDYIHANQSAQANELYDLEQKKIKELSLFAGSNEEKILILETYRLLEDDINAKYDELALQQQNEANEKKKAADEKAKADELAREKQLIADKLAAEQALAEAKWNIANASISLLGTLFQKNKKAADVAFALEKGLAIAKVVVSNRAANAEILARQLAFYSSSGPLALPLAAASAAPMFAANNLNAAASIAAIVASGVSKYMGGGGASLSSPSVGGSGGMQAPSPSNFAFVGNQPNQQPPLQAYVVSTQVSSNLEAQQLINNQARLGG